MRKKPIVRATVILSLTAIFFSALFGCTNKPSGDLNGRMQSLVSGLVERDKSIRNCVLSVMKGNGSFSWSGAAGIASQDDQVPMIKDTPIYIASITKLYTATAIMRLYEMGALSLDDPMSRYLPEELIRGIHLYKGKDYSHEITIRQLLSHTSGIADYYTEKGKDGKTLFDLFLESPERVWTVDETIERARRDLKPNFEPGMGTSYSDTNFQLLGKVIEAITGKLLHIVYEVFFFLPLGLKHTWLTGYPEGQQGRLVVPADVFYKDMNITKIRSNGSYWADGGIVSTVDEMIIFLKALNEGKIISKSTLGLMHKWHRWRFPLEYGYGTMLFKLPWLVNLMPPLWGHSGSTGSFLYYAEDLNLYMAGTMDQVESQAKSFFLMRSVMRAIQSK